MTERLKTEQLTVEQLFLRYAVPCAFIICQRGEISEDQRLRLEEAALGKVKIERKEIEKVFWRAFNRIDELAHKMKKERWHLLVIREYFLQYHNQLIDQKKDSYAKAPRTLRELCKVEKARIKEKKGEYYLVELADGRKRAVTCSFVPDAQVGDAVIVHYGYAVERAGE